MSCRLHRAAGGCRGPRHVPALTASRAPCPPPPASGGDPFSPERIDSALASLPDVDGVPALSVLWHAGQQGTAEDVAHALLERRAALETERAQQSAAARAAREQGQQTARAQALHDARDAATRSH